MAKSKQPTLSQPAEKALRAFEETKGFHDNFVARFERNYDAYEGVLKISSEAAQWTSKLHPPFIRNIVETTLAGLVDDKLAFRVRPRPKFYEPGEFEKAKAGAKAHEILLRYQLDRDRFAEKLRPFALQNAIAGLSVAKTYWRTDVREVPRLEMVDHGATLGVPGILFRPEERRSVERVFDGPTTEVVDIRDFGWHEAAVDIQRSPVVWHRVWMHINELRHLEAQGVYKNVDELAETKGFADEMTGRDDLNRDNRNRTRDMIEALEIWVLEPNGWHVTTLGNRKVELRASRPNPFWHGEHPFTACTTEPDLFKVAGFSQVAKIAHLQEAAWDLMNQMHDNVKLLNNVITAVRSDVEDPDAFVYEPGARWLVESEGAVTPIPVDPTPATVALPALSQIQQNMQNLASSQPFTSTSEARTVGADTATEAALVTNLAQRATIAMKQQLLLSYQRVGQKMVELNKQFIRRNIMVEQVGLDSEMEMVEIAPALLQGGFDFDLTPMTESLMRSERRAEANALLTTMLQVAPIQAALSQVGAATPLNMDEFVRHFLEQYDVGPVERFFSAKQPPQLPAGGQGGAPQEGGPAPQGVTAPQATDPTTSPSNPVSLSGETAMARLLAMNGGANNT